MSASFDQTKSVATGAANTVIKPAGGRLRNVLVTTAGTGSGNVLFYDSATTNSGTVIAMVPATVTLGTFYAFWMPAGAGLVCQNVLNGPVLTVSYD
jgi:hypothetical protein